MIETSCYVLMWSLSTVPAHLHAHASPPPQDQSQELLDRFISVCEDHERTVMGGSPKVGGQRPYCVRPAVMFSIQGSEIRTSRLRGGKPLQLQVSLQAR